MTDDLARGLASLWNQHRPVVEEQVARLADFVGDVERDARVARNAERRGEARRLAHSLVGVGSALDIPDLCAVAVRLEAVLAEDNEVPAARQLQQLVAELRATLHE